MLAFGLFVFVFVVYAFGVSHSVFGADSGDIILASWFGGVAHPPGYPLNTLIGWVFTHLPFNSTVAFKANLMSAFFTAGSVSFLFLINKILFKNSLIALSGALTFAFIPLIWLYAHIAEVFQLQIFLVSFSVYLLLLWKEKGIAKKNSKFLKSSVLFLGFAVFHHQTSILLVPAYALFIYKCDKKILKLRNLFKLTPYFFLGLFPYIFAFFAALKKTPVNWDDPSTLPNIIRLITRADYGSFVISKSSIGLGVWERILQVVSFFSFLKTDFTPLGVLLIGGGVVYSFIKNKQIFWFFILAAFFTGPFFLFYSSFVLTSDFLFGIWERFIMVAYFFFSIFLAYGFFLIHTFFARLIESKNTVLGLRKEVFYLLMNGLFLLFPFSFALLNWSKTDLSKNYLGDHLGHDVLVSSEPNSVIFLFDDTVTFNTEYIYHTSGNFKDRKIILGGSLKHLYYRKQVAKSYPELRLPPDFLKDSNWEGGRWQVELSKLNFEKFPVYTYRFGPDFDDKKWQDIGLLKKLVDKNKKINAEKFAEWSYEVMGSFSFKEDNNRGYTHFLQQTIKDIYYQAYVVTGKDLAENGAYKEALSYFEKAKEISRISPSAYVGLGRSYQDLENCELAKNFFLEAVSYDPHYLPALLELSRIAEKCPLNEDEIQKYKKMYEDEKLRREPSFKRF